MWFKVRRCGGPKNCTVLQRTTPVLLCTTKYCSSTTLYYKVLCQYWLALLCTTKCYSGTTVYYKELQRTSPSTTLYYSVLQPTKVLLQCCSVLLQSTSPVLLCTTQYYSNVLLQHYSVLQSTTPVLLCTTRVTKFSKVLRIQYSNSSVQ